MKVDEPVVVRIVFLIRSMLCHIGITYINNKTSEEYLLQLQRTQTDRQTDRMHEHVSTLLESVKKQKENYSTAFR